MPRQARVFYAYPNEPPNIVETIEGAVGKLRSDGEFKKLNVSIKLWKENTISGKQLISSVLSQIDHHSIFACDLTFPNQNVSFELGYAIAKFKRVFASLSPIVEDADKEYKRIYYSLFNMGYTAFENRDQLASSFLNERPWEDLHRTVLHKQYLMTPPRPEHPTLFYLKPPVATDSVLSAQEEFTRTVFRDAIVIDDPNEYSGQLLEWYAEKLQSVDAVVVHLLSQQHANHHLHNMKVSIIAGLARGFGCPLLMLAHSPYAPPSDYQPWLYVHSTAEECQTKVGNWLGDLGKSLGHRRSRRTQPQTSSQERLDLRSLFLGDPVAEHEADRLHEYFVETSSFNRAMDSPLTILVGRRGTGKTAILFAVKSELSSRNVNHVTVVKPVGYETHGLMGLLEEVRQRSERGYLIESLWKYLLYSELATNVATEVQSRPLHQPKTEAEERFLRYWQLHSDILSPPFSERLRNAVRALESIPAIPDVGQQRLRISENLHVSVINDVRLHLGEALVQKEKIALLIDGLDEPWGPGEHVGHLSELIAGLLNVAQDLPNDFRRSSSRVRPIDARIIVLLRSDIFAFIQHLIPEQDKLPIERVNWQDPQLLLRVLEERMLFGSPRSRTIDNIWSDLFPKEVVGVSCVEFILRTVMPRPRDLIHLVKGAISIAVNRAHTRVLVDDLIDAREQYSYYAFDSILKEDDPVKGKLERVLYQFARASREIDIANITSSFGAAGVTGDDVEFYLDLLCDINFFGVETATGYSYTRDEEDRRIKRNVARVLRNGATG